MVEKKAHIWLSDLCFPSTDDVLEQDIRMQYRLHRKLFLDAVVKLQVKQPYTTLPSPNGRALLLEELRR